MTDANAGRIGRKGKIRWVVSEQRSSGAGRALATLLDQVSNWPLDGFARQWWAGDYRILELTCTRPTDLDAVVTCQSSAGNEFIDVSLIPVIRSRRKSRALSSAEKDALSSVGFVVTSGHRADLSIRGDNTGHAALAERILKGLAAAFGVSSRADLAYLVTDGTRLDEMPVFQDIRPHELLALLRAAGFAARTPEDGDPTGGQSHSIIVGEPLPFAIRLVEPNDVGGYLGMRLEAAFEASLPTRALNDLNRHLLAARVIADGGRVLLRGDVSITGGVSHAAVRDRIDEWVGSLHHVAGLLNRQ